ncbi:MAG: LOG family protein, partial [Candidatus Omnitrophota bacterium]|nr:LOG family protein [Candidatus Omnitrophota bacterium]
IGRHETETFPIQETVIEHLQAKGIELLALNRVNDLTRLGTRVLDLEILAFSLYLFEVRGANILVELVSNPSGQKGGLGLRRVTMAPNYSFLLEEINAKGSEYQARLNSLTKAAQKSGEGIPYNAMRIVYKVAELGSTLRNNLPLTLRFRDGAIYPEIPTGDITRLPYARAVSIGRPGSLIHDVKEPANIAVFISQHDRIIRDSSSPITNNREVCKLIEELQKERVLVYQVHSHWPEAITIFGSARIPSTDPIYAVARELGAAIYNAGFKIRTGAGPSMMEASLEGYIAARQKAGQKRDAMNMAQGIRICLPFEQKTSSFVEDNYVFNHFVTRKMGLYNNCRGTIFFPGGFGTMDEFFEVWFRQLPVVLFGKNFWQPIIDVLNEVWCGRGWIEKIESQPFITDSIKEAIELSLLRLHKWLPSVTIIGQSEFTDKKETDIVGQITSSLLSGAVPVRSGTANKYLKRVLEKAAGEHKNTLQSTIAVPAGARISQKANRIVTSHISNHHVLITENSLAFVFVPGRVKILSRLFDIIAIVQTGKVEKRPIILVSREFW